MNSKIFLNANLESKNDTQLDASGGASSPSFVNSKLSTLLSNQQPKFKCRFCPKTYAKNGKCLKKHEASHSSPQLYSRKKNNIKFSVKASTKNFKSEDVNFLKDFNLSIHDRNKRLEIRLRILLYFSTQHLMVRVHKPKIKSKISSNLLP